MGKAKKASLARIQKEVDERFVDWQVNTIKKEGVQRRRAKHKPVTKEELDRSIDKLSGLLR